MIISIPIHSVVDTITNSSSEIFTWATQDAAKVAEDLVQELMKTMGVQGKATDYFNFNVVVDPDWMEGSIERAEEIKRYGGSYSAFTPEELKDHLNSGGWEEPDILESDGPREKGTRLEVTTKNGAPINVANAFYKMFESAEIQC